MTGSPWTGAAGRATALLLLVAVFGLAWIGIGRPMLDLYSDRDATLERKTQLLRRSAALAASLPQWRARWSGAQAETGPPIPPVVLDGMSDAVAAANLQALLQNLARQSGATINSFEVLQPEPRGAWRRIGLRVAAEGGLPVIAELLRRIQAASPSVVVGEFTLLGPGLGTRADAPPLTASFSAFGIRAGAAAEAP